ncbi:MAG: glycerol-3-phosphate acyltransferase [Armatimonadota bacterium]
MDQTLEAWYGFAWSIIGFLLGSMPFAHWITFALANTDVRLYGDGNPGTVNAWKAGGWRCGLPVLILDFAKSAGPVFAAAVQIGLNSWFLVPAALAPVLGHAFSPFLRFRGGKAVAATFGIWAGLTLWEIPTVLGLLLAAFVLVQTVDAWSVVLGTACLALYLLLVGSPQPFLMIWAGNFAVLLWKHRKDLVTAPSLRPYIKRVFGGSVARFLN